jgi:hypothetical protein
MLGYVQRTKSVILPGNKEDVLLIGSKLSVSERCWRYYNYIIYLSTTFSSIIKENKNKDSRLRKVDLKSKEFSSEVFYY